LGGRNQSADFGGGEVVLGDCVAGTVGVFLEEGGEFCDGTEDDDVVEVEVFDPLWVVPYAGFETFYVRALLVSILQSES
jgi:hypothetical protein